MPQRPENFDPTTEDPDETLVTPRFDANDARHAHPVVPLSEAPPRAAYTYTRAARTRGRRWTPALLAVALLAVAAVGGALTTKVLRGPRAEPAPEQTQEQTQAAPTQAAEAPPPQPSATEAARAETHAAAPRETRTTRRTRAAATESAVVYDDEDRDDHHGRSERRREREDDFEKELRKAMKHTKGKAPRLVDVLTRP